MRAWQRWQEAQGTLQKKREAEAKLLWANKPDKLQQAKEEITEVTDTAAAALNQASLVKSFFLSFKLTQQKSPWATGVGSSSEKSADVYLFTFQIMLGVSYDVNITCWKRY